MFGFKAGLRNSLGRRKVSWQDSPKDRINPPLIFTESPQRFLQEMAADWNPWAGCAIAVIIIFHLIRVL